MIWIKKNILPSFSYSWLVKFFLSLIFPILIVIIKPLGLSFQQSNTLSGSLLVIIWWSTGIVKKIPASAFLLLWFSIFSGAPYKVIYTFPLGETFIMLTVTYLFSQAISNSGLVHKTLMPLLLKYVNSPLKFIFSLILSFTVSIYIIPQPIARLVLIAVIFDSFLNSTSVELEVRQVLMYAVFVFYAIVNMTSKNADIIMNNIAVEVSGVQISNFEWMRAMAIPSILYMLVIIGLFIFIFKNELKGLKISINNNTNKSVVFAKAEKQSSIVIFITILLWSTSFIWGRNIKILGYISINTAITIIATVLLFITGALSKSDFKVIDITTLLFLSAAFSIGGVLKHCGAADVVFGLFKDIFPSNFSYYYLIVIIFIAMLIHMVLGSNTTTLSVVIPGLVILCSNMIRPELVVYTTIIAVSFHAILPFHSVALMIGSSKNYFPNSFITRLGIPVTPIVYLCAYLIYFPYWSLIGLI